MTLYKPRRKASYEKSSHSRFDVPSFFNMISIPLTSLHRIYFAAPRNSIYLVCKDHRTVRITLSGFENSKNKVETFVQVLQGISFYNQHSLDPRTHLFAYKNLTYFSNNEQGWNLCDLIKEYVLNKFDHRNLNLDTDEFKNLNPSAENIAVVIWNILREKIDRKFELTIRLYETERNFVEYDGN